MARRYAVFSRRRAQVRTHQSYIFYGVYIYVRLINIYISRCVSQAIYACKYIYCDTKYLKNVTVNCYRFVVLLSGLYIKGRYKRLK